MATAKRLIFLGFDKSPRCLFETITIPELKDGEILCKIRVAAICKSDLHTINGLRSQAVPSYLGHECVAEVVAHRRTCNKDLQVGQRIVFSICDSCGKCVTCLNGLPQKCTSLYKYGHERMLSMASTLSGAYSSHIILRAKTAVVAITEDLPDSVAAPINCSLATMVSAVSKIKHDTSKTVLIQGCGALGVYGCALLHDAGFSKIVCSDKIPTRLKLIRNFGGIGILAGEEQERLEPDSVDIIIEACGCKDVIDVGLSLLKTWWYIISFVGMVHPNSRLNLTAEKLIRKCLTITGDEYT
ncbi:putative L-idonate 5-dehydrogenase [Apostichopus japonicus]|uniref:Putative L-idonate 5-dehydrogenase n=1 Tax=Stichopus japonicus TaxID=307972 RepID=A0A2G8L2G1_STIJA|nr:putative L-idonate 5-dehydrogenase [Apostichopus japonicus]